MCRWQAMTVVVSEELVMSGPFEVFPEKTELTSELWKEETVYGKNLVYRKSKNVANRDGKNLINDATALVGHCGQGVEWLSHHLEHSEAYTDRKG